MMKKIVGIITVLIFALQANAQQFIYEYENKTIPDYSEEHLLAVKGNMSYYQALNYLNNKVYLDSVRQIGATIVAAELVQAKLKPVIEKKNGQILRMESILGSKLSLELTQEDLNWQLNSETKQVDGKTLHKATTHYGGRDWIAWYNMEIPLQEGPYVFTGLPGLIEEVTDTEKIFHFKLKGKYDHYFKEKLYPINSRHLYQTVDYNEFIAVVAKAKENPFEFSSTNMPMISNYEIPEERKRYFNKKFGNELKDYIIERPEPKE